MDIPSTLYLAAVLLWGVAFSWFLGHLGLLWQARQRRRDAERWVVRRPKVRL